MNYVLTEEEFNRLYAVRGQLRMLASLLCAGSTQTNGDTLCRPADLGEFMDAQSEVLTELERSIETRFEAQRQADQMLPSDWLHLIRIISGEEDKAPGDSAASIDSKLRASAQIDNDMAPVHAAWLDAIVLAGERRRPANTPSTQLPMYLANWPGQSRALEDYVNKARLTSAQCIEIGRELLALKESCRHGEFLKRLEAIPMDDRRAQRFMETVQRFANTDSWQLLSDADTQSKVFELLALNDAQIETLEKTGAVGRLTRADIQTMTVKELRAAIHREREALAEAGAQQSAKPRRTREKLATVPA